MNLLCHRCACSRNNLVVVFHFLALEHKRLHSLLTAVENDYRSDSENCLRMEVILRISYRDCGVDVAGHNFKNGRIALYDHILCLFRHLLRGAAGYCCKSESDSQEFDALFHCL